MRAVDRRLVAVDTSFVVSLRGGDGKELQARARRVLDLHQKDVFCIPAPALAECLPGQIPPGLQVLDMNQLAAQIASTFKGAIKNRPPEVSKREISVDLFILATAEAHGASVLYTRDDVFKLLATEHKLKVQVRDLPDREPSQGEIPLGPRPVRAARK